MQEAHKLLRKFCHRDDGHPKGEDGAEKIAKLENFLGVVECMASSLEGVRKMLVVHLLVAGVVESGEKHGGSVDQRLSVESIIESKNNCREEEEVAEGEEEGVPHQLDAVLGSLTVVTGPPPVPGTAPTGGYQVGPLVSLHTHSELPADPGGGPVPTRLDMEVQVGHQVGKPQVPPALYGDPRVGVLGEKYRLFPGHNYIPYFVLYDYYN